MAKKAGRLAVGSEAAAIAARRGEARLIITAGDASDASIRRAKSNADANNVKYIAVPFTMFELGQTAGRGSPGTIAFLDKGLAEGFIKKLAEITAGNNATNSTENTIGNNATSTAKSTTENTTGKTTDKTAKNTKESDA